MSTILVLALALMVWPAQLCGAALESTNQESVSSDQDPAEASDEAPDDTAFTYRGQLPDPNSLVDGHYDFEFKLFDDPNVILGYQVGGDVKIADVEVIDGYFSVELDFHDPCMFAGYPAWLEIGVRLLDDPGDPDKYTKLPQRYEVLATGNTVYGTGAGASITTGNYNSAVGYYALTDNTTGSYNSAVGRYALRNNTKGQYNSAMGTFALNANTTGTHNVAMGYLALYENTTASYNSAMGNYALRNNTTGQYNSAMGTFALNANTTGTHNVAMGYLALYENTTGSYNSAMGNYALRNNTTGIRNSAMGHSAGYNNATGSYNVFLGYKAGYNETGSHRLYIANSPVDPPLIYGAFDTGRVGIGTTSPAYKLDVSGSIRATGTIYGNIAGSIANADKVDGYHAGNSSGQIAVSNGTLCTNLNADRLDGLHSSSFLNTSNDYGRSGIASALYEGTTTLSNKYLGISATAVNSDKLDGYHAGNSSGQIAVSNGTLCTNLNADRLDGLHSSSFLNTSNDYGRSGIASALYEGTTTLSNKYLGISATSVNSDKLDGQHGAYYRDWDNLTDVPAGFADGIDDVGGGGLTLPYSGTTSTSGSAFSITNGGSGRAIYGLASNSGNVYNYGGYFEAAGMQGRGVFGRATNTGDYENYGGYFLADGGRGVGVHGHAVGDDGIGVRGVASKSSSGINYGGHFTAYGLSGSGIYGAAINASGVYNYGVYGTASGTNGHGVHGVATSDYGNGVYGECSNIGVYGTSSAGTGVYGSGGSSASTKAGVRGTNTKGGNGVYGYSYPGGTGVRGYGGSYDFYAAGPGTDYGSSSSIRWKSDVRAIDEPLEKVMNLRGVYFDWDSEHGGGHDVGMIAEEVGEVVPEIVDYEENGTDAIGMDYSKLTPLLVEAVKALNVQADEREKRLAEKDVKITVLKDRLSVLESQQKENAELRNRVTKMEALVAMAQQQKAER